MRNLILISLLFFTACRLSNKHIASAPSSFASIDTSHYAIIPVKVGEEVVPSVPLSALEIYKIDSLIKQTVTRHNKTADQYQSIKDPGSYYKQLWATTNDKQEKEVFINCLCDTLAFPDWNWRKKKALVIDGGNCFFEMELNLKTDSVYFLSVNNTAGVIHVK